MTPQDIVILFRKQVADEAAPYLWDEDEVLQYLIDAQDTFVRKMGGISAETVTSGTAELNDLAVTLNTPYTAFSPYILRIRSAKLLTAKRSVSFMSEADVGLKRIADPYQNEFNFTLPKYLDDTDIGPVQSGVLGYVDGKVRWYKVPNATDTCRLHIYRLPYPRLTAQEGSFEIDEQHHLSLIKWMKSMAYSKEDSETYDKDLAASNKAEFLEYCGEARQEKDRQRYKPRIVQYGGL